MTNATLTVPESDDVIDEEEPIVKSSRITWVEIALAAAAFIGFCVVILLKKAQLMEPDDYAYRASIVALSQGHLELTTAQYHALSTQVGGIQQWTKLPNGKWMSEKNPGYPFFAVFFYWIHALRFAPLFAGGLASTSLFLGARKWLGKWAGTYAVIFFLGSGMALAFGYRATMPTFTDASLIAAGAGAVLWAMISQEASATRRTVIGLLGFLSIEFAVFMRYTDGVMLVVAAAAVVLAYKPARLSKTMLAWWLGSIAAFAAMVLIFDSIVYGSPTKTGYSDGEITFSNAAIIPNLKHMPELLVRSVPAMILAGIAVLWIIVRLVRSRVGSLSKTKSSAARRDGLIIGFLAAGWLGLWAFYIRYNWTAQMYTGSGGRSGGLGGALPSGQYLPRSTTGTSLPSALGHAITGAAQRGFAAAGRGGGVGGGGGAIHLIRFYVPAIGLIALLAVWVVMQLPRWVGPLLAAGAVVTALGSFHTLTAGGGMGGAGFPGGTGFPGGSGSRGRFPSGGFTPGNYGSGNFQPLTGGAHPPIGGGYGGPPGLQNGTMPDGRPPGQ